MNHADHVELLRKAEIQGGVWADLGSGAGAFTLALRDLGGKDIQIFSLDKDKESLKMQRRRMAEMFPKTDIYYVHADFSRKVFLPKLDGIIMANSLHFVKNQQQVLCHLHDYLQPNGKLILVEYNDDKGNQWVPYPVSFHRFLELAEQTRFSRPEKMQAIPSQFMNEIYSAIALRNFL